MEFTIKDLWNSLTPEEVEDSCRCALEIRGQTGGEFWDAMNRALAMEMRVRPKFLASRSVEKTLPYLVARAKTDKIKGLQADLIKALIIMKHREVMVMFLDACGIPNNSGFLDGDIPAPSVEDFARGIGALLNRFSSKTTALYLGWMFLRDGELWKNIVPALSSLGLDLREMLNDEQTTNVTTQDEAHDEEPSQRAAEDSDQFTTLDAVLIRATVSSALGEIGSLSPTKLQDLVEEVVLLDTGRQHSVFHRGFSHVLLGEKPSFNTPGENEERRLWYFTGVLMGLIRNAEREKVLTVLEENEELFALFCKIEGSRFSGMLVPELYPILFSKAAYAKIFSILRNLLDGIPDPKRMWLCWRVQKDASFLIRKKDPATAGNLLNLLDGVVRRSETLSEEFKANFLPKNERRRAQVLQLNGDFKGATELLSRNLESEDPSTSAQAYCDLGLIKAGFRSLMEVTPPSSKDKVQALRDGLMRGKGEFEKALSIDGTTAPNASFCLAVLDVLEALNHKSAADHLNAALSGMLEMEFAYAETGLIGWTKFLLGISLMECAEPAFFHRARALIDELLETSEVYPEWLWVRGLLAAAVFDDQEPALKIAEYLLGKIGDGASEPIWESDLPKTNSAIRARYLEWLESPGVIQSLRWTRYRELLPHALKLNHAQASDILDGMEKMALEDPARRGMEFCNLLENEDSYSPAWTGDDAVLTRVGILESAGRIEDAVVALKGIFYRYQAKGDEISTAEAMGMLEWIQEVTPDDPELSRMENLVRVEIPLNVSVEIPVKVIYVGGNETQAQYESKLRAELGESYPNLELEFFFTDWTSNWNKHLDKVVASLADADALVLNKLVRTQFGRSVRAECDGSRPWFPCTGRGKDSLKRSIENAARWAMSNKGN